MELTQDLFPPGTLIAVYRPDEVDIGTRDVTASPPAPTLEISAGSPAVAASLEVGDEGNDNALRFTAQNVGAAGNDIQVNLDNGDPDNAVLAVGVVDTVITVSLETVGAVVQSTAAEVLAAIEADVGADALVAVAHVGTSDGSGSLDGVGGGQLQGGEDAGSQYGTEVAVVGDDGTLEVAVDPDTRPYVAAGLISSDPPIYRYLTFYVDA